VPICACQLVNLGGMHDTKCATREWGSASVVDRLVQTPDPLGAINRKTLNSDLTPHLLHNVYFDALRRYLR
jgi:hypothetical protein